MQNVQPQPVQFIVVDHRGKCQINEQAKKILCASQNKVAIISICGLYRTGKSYILNQLLGIKNAFQVDPTVNACTKGLWFWSEPVTIEKDGEIFDIYLMDSEGLGGTEKNLTYDTKIFTLAVLLSSFLIYNQFSVIDEKAISNLSLVTNLAQNIQVKTQGVLNQEANANQLSQYFPQFLWLLRDFMLELADPQGNPLTPTEYLEQQLSEQILAQGARSQEKNQIRKMIKNYFKYRYCFTMIRPVINEKDLQRLEDSTLKREFLEQVEELKIFVFNRIKPLRINGLTLKGPDFSLLAEEYVKQINQSGVPTITDAWQTVVEQQLKTAHIKALKSYQKDLKTYVQQFQSAQSISLSALHLEHKDIKAKSLKYFGKHLHQIDSLEVREKYERDLRNAIKETYAIAQKRAKQELEKQAKDLLAELYRETILPKQYTELQVYFKDWNKIQKNYLEVAESSEKYEIWSKFAAGKMMEGALRIQRSQEGQTDLKLKQMELEVNRLNNVLEMKEKGPKNYKQAQDEENRRLVQRINQLQQGENELQQNIQAYSDLLDRKNEEIASLQEQVQRGKAGNLTGTQSIINGRTDVIMEGEKNLPMCGTGQSECSIF